MIGYLVGADACTAFEPDERGVALEGNTDFFKLRTRDPKAYARLQVTPDFFERKRRYPLERFDVLVNLVTDADLNPRVLANIERMLDGYKGRVLNPPAAILKSTREQIAKACSGLDHVLAPKTLRLAYEAPADFPYPAILRLTGTHTGEVLGVAENAAQARAMLRPDAEHFLTEFVDFRSPDGLYRKYRFVIIGGEIVMRHMLASDCWNVHAADRDRFMRARPDLIAEERDAIAYGLQALPHPVRAGLAAIRGAVGLDFFGLDCAFSPEGVTLFEANATMNFFPLAGGGTFAYLGAARARAERAFNSLLFSRPAPAIGYLAGSDADTGIDLSERGLKVRGSSDIFQLRTRDPDAFTRLHVIPNYFDQPVRYELDRFDVLLNLVTDADINPRVLGVLAELVKGFEGRLINPPATVLRTSRDAIAGACHGLPHVIAPKALRLTGEAPEDFPYPGILRLAGTHAGRILGLVESAGDAAALLVPGEPHYLTQFVDFRGPDGLYRKYRFYWIGDALIVRHLIVSDRWKVHGEAHGRFMLGRPELIAEARRFVEAGADALPRTVRSALDGIRHAVGLDFFGIDCTITDRAELLLFEVNATMTFLNRPRQPQFDYVERAFERGRAAFDRLLFG
jgi:hypothetical protein